MDLLEPVTQPYAWGSRLAIAAILGRPTPSPGPEAELWVGAHPSGPSGLRRDDHATTLDAVIAADPARELGAWCLGRFGPRLPFLLKILAADKALSIQVHPGRAGALAGFRAENMRGIALDDPARNYVDTWPKPEVLCALTTFEALAGFRAPGEAADLLDALGLAEFTPITTELRARQHWAGTEGASGLRAALAAILDWPVPARPELVARVVAACARLAGRPGPYAAAAGAAVRVASDHPGDLGVPASLLLRHLVLEPGAALFMPAGGIHAYLRGVGIELLANSDNVLRAGLTAKHVDVPELLRMADPAVQVPVLAPVAVAPSVYAYDTPAPEFRLYRLDLAGEPVSLPGVGPRLTLCIEGEAVLHDAGGDPVKLGRGGACFISAADQTVTATGPATLYAAAVG